jgi:streptogramin lyase
MRIARQPVAVPVAMALFCAGAACGGDDTAGGTSSDGGRESGPGAGSNDATFGADTSSSSDATLNDASNDAPDVNDAGASEASDAVADVPALEAGDAASQVDGASDAAVVLPPCSVTRYSVPDGGNAQWIAPSPDGELWFSSPNTVGRVSPLGPDGGQGAATILAQTGSLYSWGPLTAGPDGQMWIVDGQLSKLHQFQTADGGQSSSKIDNAAVVTRASGSSLWFADTLSATFGRAIFTQDDAGAWAWSTASVSYPNDDAIVTGADDAVWVLGEAVDGGESFTRAVSLADGGIGTAEFVFPPAMTIASGPDGRIWFVDESGSVGRIVVLADAGTIGAVDQIATPGLGLIPTPGQPVSLAVGPDGAMYATDFYSHRIVRITPTGDVSQCGLPDDVYPFGITAGPDGRVWFAASDVFALDSLGVQDAGASD